MDKEYVFIRKEGFYCVPLPNPLNLSEKVLVLDNVNCNPGTIRVEDVFGNVVWPDPYDTKMKCR